MSQPLDPAGAEGALIRAAMAGDDALADAIAERFPGVRRDPPACALLLADPAAADRLTEASVNAAVDPSDWPPLLLLCGSRYRTGDRILASGAVSLRPADHLWICRAARSRDPQAMALLLAGGADPGAVDDDGQTALHLAALAGDLTGCRSLLAAGADPRALNYAGQTPLDCAQGVEEPTARAALAALLRDAAPSRGTARFDDPAFATVFERAADAVVTGDVDGLRALLREHPELATARSSRPHRCTLLHYLAANGVEGERPRTPANAVEVIEMLIGARSDPNASCADLSLRDDVYDGTPAGWAHADGHENLAKRLAARAG